jgi:hypothetical protein
MAMITIPVGFEWGNYPFGKHDWEFIQSYIVENNVKNVLEIGSGLSSLLISQLCHVDTLENNVTWCDKVTKSTTDIHDLDLYPWDGVNWPDFQGKRYDFVFIDGPDEHDPIKSKAIRYSGIPRQISFINAINLTDVIFVHDCTRVAEMTWQLFHLSWDFHVTDMIKSDDSDSCRNMSVWKRIKT